MAFPPLRGGKSPPSSDARIVLPRYVVLWLMALWAVVTVISLAIYQHDQRTAGAWGCEMSYMTPSYFPLEWEENPAPRYSLYLYREAGFDPQAPSGHPVIFIPGNAGSFKQVRSIASSASRQYYANTGSGPWSRPLDFFAADFNEDLSAVHAPTLKEQGEFLAAAIPRVLSAYDHLPADRRPSQVTLLGHSMGGIVARLAATAAGDQSIDAIITMSTPHTQPPVALQLAMRNLYNRINWRGRTAGDQPPPILISICGGQSDGQIVSDACALPSSVITPDDGFAVFTTGMPGVWTGVEHQAMVWCHQVRWRVARALLDMSIQRTRAAKLGAARHWLLGPTQLKALPPQTQDLVSYKVDVDAHNTSIIAHYPGINEAAIADPPIYVRYCRSEGDCDQQYPAVQVIPWLPDETKPFPSAGEGSRPEESAFVVDLETVPPSTAWVEVVAPRDATIVTGRQMQARPDGRWVPQASAAPSTHTVLSYTQYPLSTITVFELEVKLGQCSGPHPIVEYKASPVDALRETTVEQRFFPVRDGELIPLHSHISGSPSQSGSQDVSEINLHIYQQPQCQVERVDFHINLSASLAKAMLRWRVAALSWVTGWIVLVLSLQLGYFTRNGSVPTAGKVARYGDSGANAAAAVMFGLLGLGPVQALASALGLPGENLSLGYTKIVYALLAYLAGGWSMGTAVAVYNVMSFLVSAAGKLMGKPKYSDAEVGYPPLKEMLPRLALGVILLLAVHIFVLVPAGLVYAVLFLVFFALTAGASHDDDQSRVNLFTTLLTLMLLQLPFHLPDVAVWGKNLWAHGGRSFPSDHTIVQPLSILLLVLVCSFDTRISAKSSVEAGRSRYLTLGVVAVAFVFAAQSPYMLVPAVDLVFIMVARWLLTKRESGAGEK